MSGPPPSHGADKVVKTLVAVRQTCGPRALTGQVNGRGQLDHGDVVGVAVLVVAAVAVDVRHLSDVAATHVADVADSCRHSPVLPVGTEECRLKFEFCAIGSFPCLTLSLPKPVTTPLSVLCVLMPTL